MGSEVQGVSQSRAYLMEVSSDREGRVARTGFPYQRDELFLHSTLCKWRTTTQPQTRRTAHLHSSSFPPLQVGHPVLPPSGFHPGVHHGAGPGSQAGARVQQAQREDDRALHRQRAGPPLLVQGTGSEGGSGGSSCCCLTPKATGEPHASLEVHRSRPKSWGC